MWYCSVIELHAYDFIIKDFVITEGVLFVPDPVYPNRQYEFFFF